MAVEIRIRNCALCREKEEPIKGSRKKTSERTRMASQSWKNIKAVMAYYNSLRKIKRLRCVSIFIFPFKYFYLFVFLLL